MRIPSILVSCLFVIGCGKGASSQLDEIADHACACRRDDEACGQKVLVELKSYTEANKTSGVSKHVTETGIRINECLNATGVKQKDFVAAMEKMIK
jgi:hypothetical protein